MSKDDLQITLTPFDETVDLAIENEVLRKFLETLTHIVVKLTEENRELRDGDNNWQNVTPFSERYYAALMRHMAAWQAGEQFDAESGKSHLAHAACCLMFLMWGEENEK